MVTEQSKKNEMINTGLKFPRELYRQVHVAAALEGLSVVAYVRKVVTADVERKRIAQAIAHTANGAMAHAPTSRSARWPSGI